MQITVTRRKVFLHPKYDVHQNGVLIYFGGTEFGLIWQVQFFEKKGERPAMIIDFGYTITRWDNNVLNFNGRLGDYQCYCGQDNYRIYQQKGIRYTVYKNDMQVAWLGITNETLFGVREYTITANSDVDVPLVAAFCVILDNIYQLSNPAISPGLTVDLGNISAPPFNEDWKPDDGL